MSLSGCNFMNDIAQRSYKIIICNASDLHLCLIHTGVAQILAYLNEKNRPYSAQDVFTNLQKQCGLGKTVKRNISD